MNTKPELSPALKDKFALAPGAGVGEYRFRGERILLDRINLETAERIVNRGFPYLVKIEPREPKKTASEKNEPTK